MAYNQFGSARPSLTPFVHCELETMRDEDMDYVVQTWTWFAWDEH